MAHGIIIIRRVPDCSGYVDYFSDDNRNHEPVVLEDGTSVAYPAGWTDEDADKWRKGNDLQPPSPCASTAYDLL